MGSIIGGALGAVGSIFGSNEAASAQKEAADKNLEATMAALAQQQRMYNTNSANIMPWITGGQNAQTTFNNALGLNGTAAQNAYFTNFQNDPYYQKTLQAGLTAMQNSAAARGTLDGGNTLSALNDYSGNLQRQAYDNRLSQIGSVAQAGLTGANALAGVGASTAASEGNQLIQGTNNAASNIANAGYYTGAGLTNAFNAAGKAWNSTAPAGNNASSYFGGSNPFSFGSTAGPSVGYGPAGLITTPGLGVSTGLPADYGSGAGATALYGGLNF